jgi:hypothetical protein
MKTIAEFKKWIANIPESMNDVQILYVDFHGWDGPLSLIIEERGGAIIEEGLGRPCYVDRRESQNE